MKDLSFLKNQLLFAHRGIYDNVRIYENTISSFTRALKYNLPIAINVRLTLDQKIVVFHDDNMERLLHVDGQVENINYDELCYIAKYQIPLLEEVLNLVNGAVPLLIEIKTLTRKYLLENNIVKLLDNYNGLFAIQSFSARSLKWFYKNKKNYIIGYQIGQNNYKSTPFFKKFDFINIEINSIKESKFKYLKEKYILLGWKITNQEEYDNNKYIYDSLVCDDVLEITKF